MRRFGNVLLAAGLLWTCSFLSSAVSFALGATLVIKDGQTISGTVAANSVVNGDALRNTLIIDGGVLQQNGYGGESRSGGNAVGNAVILRSGRVDGSLMGGLSLRGSASANSVIINGGHVEGDVIGGRAPQGNAVYNTITLSGSPTFSPLSVIFGGLGRAGGDEITGNTLNFLGFRGSLGGLDHFQIYNFALQPDSRSGGPLVTLSQGPVPLGQSRLRLLSVGGNSPWQVGDKVTLFNQASGLPQQSSTTAVRQGLSMLYDFDLTMNGSALAATVTRAEHDNPQAPVVLKPQAAALGLATQALELVAGFGMESAWRAAAGSAKLEAPERSLWQPFAAMSAGSLNYDAGAEVRLRGASGLAGLSRRWTGPFATVMLGGFGEGGRGDYRGSEGMPDGSTTTAQGKVDYYGAGLLARVDMEHGAWRGWHAELSTRMGRVGTDFRSGELDLPDHFGGIRSADFSTEVPYYSAHAGLGHRWDLTEALGLDLYIRGFWTRVEGSSVTVLGEGVSFASTNSVRVQGGARFSQNWRENWQFYAGLAWEQELDGRVRGSVSGYSMPTASLQGATLIGELGLGWRPDESWGENWGINLGVQGLTGKREGVLGRLELTYVF